MECHRLTNVELKERRLVLSSTTLPNGLELVDQHQPKREKKRRAAESSTTLTNGIPYFW